MNPDEQKPDALEPENLEQAASTPETPQTTLEAETPALENVTLEAQTPEVLKLEPPAKVTLKTLLAQEFGLFKGRPLLWGALGLIMLIPALYAVMYLSSVWDPYGQLNQLPVAFVSSDKGTSFQNKPYNLGKDLEKKLLKDQKFHFKVFSSVSEARTAVDEGQAYFAVIVPEQFSFDAVPGKKISSGEITIYAAEGTSYFASTLGKRFGSELAHTLNETLTEKRWEAVFAKLDELRTGFGKLKSASIQLQNGAKQLETGSAKLETGATDLSNGLNTASTGSTKLATAAGSLSSGVKSLTTGVSKISSGIQTMSSKLPAQTDLSKLEAGSTQVAQGSSKLADGLVQLGAGANQLGGKATELSNGLVQLNAGASQVSSGAKQLSSGIDNASVGSTQLVGGTKQLEPGVKQLTGGVGALAPKLPAQMQTALPSSEQLTALNQGATGVNQGAQNLNAGLSQLQAGASKLEAGSTQLETGLISASTGSQQLAVGANQLSSKTTEAATGATTLSSGANQLEVGVKKLTSGMTQLNAGIQTLNTKMPAQTDLDKLMIGAKTLGDKSQELSSGLGKLATGGTRIKNGLNELHTGSIKLASGLEQFTNSIPSDLEKLPGDAKGLAVSVTTKDEFSAPVPNNGTAFSPYFIALSIWMGAVMMSFVLHFTRLPENARNSSQFSKMLEKLSLPVMVALLQSIFLMLALRYILQIEIPNGFGFVLVMLLGSLGFLFVINALLTILGDAGRLLAVVLLVFQLAAAGSAYPIELSPPLFRAVHSILPITNIIKALRAVLFGSYQGHWQTYALNLALVGVIALALTWLIGRWRWRFVANENYAPALETSI